MKEIIIKVTNNDFNVIKYFLSRRYGNKRIGMNRLAKIAILREVSSEAKKEAKSAYELLEKPE